MRFTAALVAIAAMIMAVAANPAPCGPSTPPVDTTDPAFDKRQCGVYVLSSLRLCTGCY